MSPSEKLGIPWPWQWLVDANPIWAAVVVLFVTPLVIKFVMRPVIEGRFVRGSYEFVAFQADVLFAPAILAALTLVRAMDDRVYLRADNPFHWIVLAAGIGMGIFHYIPERKMYSWKQMTSLTKIYHELLFPFFGYLLVMVGGAGFIHAPWTFDMILARFVFVVSMALYLAAWPAIDEKLKDRVVESSTGKTRYDFAHVDDSWPWQHKYRHLRPTWRAYVDSWRQLLSV